MFEYEERHSCVSCVTKVQQSRNEWVIVEDGQNLDLCAELS